MAHPTKRWRGFESLESRTMLAADVVTAVVTNHNLAITAAGSGYDFVVSGDGTAGDVIITGYADQTSGVGTQVDGTQNGVPVSGTPVLGYPDAQIKLTGVTGNITINLGAGGVAVNVQNLTIDKDLSITAGNGSEGIALDSLTVTGDATITGGSGNLSIQLGSPATAFENYPGAPVNIGGNLSITAGNGNDDVLGNFLTVGGNESISLGSGDNNVGLNEPETEPGLAIAIPVSVQPPVATPTPAATPNSIAGNLLVQLGSGNSSFYAADTHVGGTLIVTGGSSLDAAGNVSSAVRAAATALPASIDHGNHSFTDKPASPAAGAPSSAATDTITLVNDTAAGAGIFTGVADTDSVTVQGSTFGDLGVGLGAGKGSLSIGTTTTTHSTTLVGLGTSNTYADLGGNSFANLYTQGLTPPPTATSPPASPPLATPVAMRQSGQHSWQ